jgi:predicted ABC-type ATPase
MTSTEPNIIIVLSGVNGAGKSSIGAYAFAEAGIPTFNPDAYAQQLRAETGMSREAANSAAWTYGKERLEAAIASGDSYAFETTLGGNTIPALLRQAAGTHDLTVWYCGLSSPELHIERVKSRVAHGGHDIPEHKIRERWINSISNLIDLMPHATHLYVFDNSATAAPGDDIPDSIPLLTIVDQKITYPDPNDAQALSKTPDWAKAIIASAVEIFQNPINTTSPVTAEPGLWPSRSRL